MSDRLAVSATISVLMMSIYVLFGADAVRMPIGPQQLEMPAEGFSAPELPGSPGRSVQFIR